MFFGLLGKKPACPYCYTRVSSSGLFYRCLGWVNIAGKDKCKKTEDPTRVRVLSSSEAVLPSFKPDVWRSLLGLSQPCPHCQNLTKALACPNCHSALPADFTPDSPLFGIVGVRGSGKTVFLAVLSKELVTTIPNRTGATISEVAGNNNALLKRLANTQAEMERGGSLPIPTASWSKEETVPAVFNFRLSKANLLSKALSRSGHLLRMRRKFRFKDFRSTVAATFSFYDTAGEDLTSNDSARDLHYLAATDGLILLLDPFGFPKNREVARTRGVDETSLRDEPRVVLGALKEVLFEAERLGQKSRIRKPIAVVLGKIDAFFERVNPDDPMRSPSPRVPFFDERESLNLHERVASLISEWGGEDVLAMLDAYFETYRFFVASSLGIEPDYRAGRVSSQGIHPHRVAEPFLWLLARRGLIETKV